MQRYFIDVIVGDQVLIKGNDAHHIKNVMRMKVGDQIICVANEKVFKCEITIIDEDSVEAIAIEAIKETNELPFKITLIYGLVKNEKFDFVVQKATELGVDRIVPLRMKRSIVKLDEAKAEKRVSRWNAIAKEAAEQCHRSTIPEVTEVINLSQVADFENAEVKLLAHEDMGRSKNHSTFKEAVQFLKPGMEMIIAIGPEGGIDPIENDVFLAGGYVPVSLGKRILRTETAPIFVLSSIVYEHELNNKGGE